MVVKEEAEDQVQGEEEDLRKVPHMRPGKLASAQVQHAIHEGEREAASQQEKVKCQNRHQKKWENGK